MNLFGLELFSPRGQYVCITEPPHPPAAIPQRSERLGLRSRGSGPWCVWGGEGTPGGMGRGAAGDTGCGCRRSEAPEEPRGERAGEEGLQEPGWRGPYVWIFLAKGCREACWSCARLQRAPLSPSLSRALKIQPETKTSVCVCVRVCNNLPSQQHRRHPSIAGLVTGSRK